MDHKREEIYKELADRYVEQYGARLQQEADELNTRHPAHVSIRRKTDRRLAQQRNRRYTAVFGALAACIVLFAALRLVLPDGAVLPPDIGTATPGPVIPLSFTLPAEFTVTDVDQDFGKTIYLMEHKWRDNVVLTLEHPEKAPVWDDFERHVLHGETVYLKTRADFNLLAFERDGVLHSFSCRYDINTLIELHKEIVKYI
jgi:hypothetical protein